MDTEPEGVYYSRGGDKDKFIGNESGEDREIELGSDDPFRRKDKEIHIIDYYIYFRGYGHWSY